MVVCLYVSPGWTGGLSRVSPAYVSWDRLQRPRDPNEDEAVLIMDGWMDQWSSIWQEWYISEPAQYHYVWGFGFGQTQAQTRGQQGWVKVMSLFTLLRWQNRRECRKNNEVAWTAATEQACRHGNWLGTEWLGWSTLNANAGSSVSVRGGVEECRGCCDGWTSFPFM